MRNQDVRPTESRSQGLGSNRYKLRLDESGAHVFDRRSGLNLLMEDVVASPRSWASAPRFVAFALTNACDLDCPFCYAPKNRARLRFDQVSQWCRELAEAGCLGVGFGGGEPTVFPRFPDLCREVARSTDLAVTMTTHGHHLDEKMADALRGSVHFIRLSVDGVGSTYEDLRGRPFVELKRSLEVATTIAPLGINTVVNTSTVHDLDAVLELAESLRARELLLLPERSVRRPGADAALRDELASWISAIETPVQIAIAAPDADKRLPRLQPFKVVDSIRDYAHVDASGCVARTSFESDREPIGPSLLRALSAISRGVG